jgi:rhamnulokinase
MSIDTWGVDYVLLNGEKEILPVYAYRDSRTKRVINEVHNLISFERLYEITGSQFQEFNTIYQLYEDKLTGRLNKATDFLFIITFSLS